VKEDEEVWVKCDVCGKGFDNYPEMIAHLEGHIEELQEKLKRIKKEKKGGD